MSLISVVIPVYNTQQYLVKCIGSVLKQTYTNLEIIILNDGSSDNSEDLILPFLQIDKRIRYYKHDNIGLGPTRNRGISLSTGDYLYFVDSDDYIEPEMIESLYQKAIEDQSDVVCCETVINNERSGVKTIRKQIQECKLELTNENKEMFFRDYYFGRVFTYNAWDKLYKASMIKDNNILFGDNKCIFAEDNYFQLQVITWAQVISFINKPLYHYVIRSSSIMNTYKRNLIERNLNMINHFSDWFKEKVNNDIYRRALSVLAFDAVNSVAINVVENKKSIKELTNSVEMFLQNEYFKEYSGLVLRKNSLSLEPNSSRRYFIYSITWLMDKGSKNIVSLLLYLRCKLMR